MNDSVLPLETIRVVSVNWDYGGLDNDGSDARWRRTVNALQRVRPHVVLCQEFTAPQPALRLRRHLWRTANELGMEPVLGPVVPHARSALHTAIMVDVATTGWSITADGPYPEPDPTAHAWCMVELDIPGLGRPLCCYSVHMPARSSVEQRSQAEYLGALVSARPEDLVLVGGDFNGYPRGGPTVTSDELQALPPHLKVTRCRIDADGNLGPNYDVDDVFVALAELVDIAAHLRQTHRDPPQLRPTGLGGARVDRLYGSPEFAAVATSYQHLTIGSDHDALVVHLALARVCTYPTRPRRAP
jgi:endonuclease/exonuclease/phosphatase (EEP) superfamily protein YafD